MPFTTDFIEIKQKLSKIIEKSHFLTGDREMQMTFIS